MILRVRYSRKFSENITITFPGERFFDVIDPETNNLITVRAKGIAYAGKGNLIVLLSEGGKIRWVEEGDKFRTFNIEPRIIWHFIAEIRNREK